MTQDNVLIARAQAGDEEAYAELMRAHYVHVYRVVIKIVNNPHDAEDVVQETFFSAYRGLPQLEDRRKFKGWLTEIARNRARDQLRKKKGDTVPIDEVSGQTLQTSDTVADELIRNEQRELIRRAMETLSETDREIARAYYLEGASYDELIQTHGLSYKAISFRLSRAKQRLIKRLKHLLTVIFLPPATTLKQIYSGGLIAMKIGTAPKITVGAIGIIALLSVGVHQIILPKFEGKNTASSVQTDASSKERVETEANQEMKNRQTRHQISNQDRLRSKVGRNRKNATLFERTTDAVKPVVTPNEASNSLSEAEDEEFEAQWKELQELAKEYFGKDIEELLADLRSDVDESVAQIEPLFEDMAFYESQMEAFQRQEKLAELSVAWKEFCEVENKLYKLYIFLSEGPAIEQFGDFYLSTPEYIKLKAFAEDWYARQEKH